LLGGRERRSPLNGRDDLDQYFLVQPAPDPAQVSRQFGDDAVGRQTQNLVTGDVRVAPQERMSCCIDAHLANRERRVRFERVFAISE